MDNILGRPSTQCQNIGGQSGGIMTVQSRMLASSCVPLGERLEDLEWRKIHLAKAKLKQASSISALLAGFAMVAMVEATISPDVPEALLIVFSVSTTLVVVVHLVAVMVSTCILPDIEAICDSDARYDIKLSPHETMAKFVELAWIFSTGLGIFLFMAQMAVIAWIRFYSRSVKATVASMVIICPAIILFALFAVRYYHQLISLKYRRSAKEIAQVEAMMTEMEESPLVIVKDV